MSDITVTPMELYHLAKVARCSNCDVDQCYESGVVSIVDYGGVVLLRAVKQDMWSWRLTRFEPDVFLHFEKIAGLS